MTRHIPFWLTKLARDKRGNILITAALALPPLLATLGLAFEGSSWYQAQRSMQNAADSAAIAAASNGTSSFAAEARAVAAQYGFQDGVGDVSVTVTNTAGCLGGGADCYSVSITKAMPLILAQLVGYEGDATVESKPAKTIKASAVSVQEKQPRRYCILALAGSGARQGIRTNGAPKSDLKLCDVMSNTDAVCNGHNLNAGYGDAHGSSLGCGVTQTPDLPVMPDPYSSLASNISEDSCKSYPQAPAKKKDPELPAANKLSGMLSWSGVRTLCGDVELVGDVTLVTGSAGLTLVIRNGRLDTNGYTLKTASGSALTLVFSGDGTAGYQHTPAGGGTLDITAPASGPWSGVAIYQDPRLASGVNVSEAGNSPTWKVTGLVYLPHASVTFSGAVGKSSSGQSCFAMVVDNITINGAGSMLDNGECEKAGLTLPTANLPSRGKLIS